MKFSGTWRLLRKRLCTFSISSSDGVKVCLGEREGGEKEKKKRRVRKGR